MLDLPLSMSAVFATTQFPGAPVFPLCCLCQLWCLVGAPPTASVQLCVVPSVHQRDYHVSMAIDFHSTILTVSPEGWAMIQPVSSLLMEFGFKNFDRISILRYFKRTDAWVSVAEKG